MGESPERCGYTQEQMATALDRLSSTGVKQIGTDAAHLFHLLLQKKLIPKDSVNALLAADHPHIMKLRFDNERSTLNDVPQKLYGSLIKIFLEYAEGAVQRQNKQWSEFNVLSSLLQSSAYPFELSLGENAGVNTHLEYHWATHTWTEMEEKLKVVDTAILPCGSIEQHGPHLPLDVDYFDSVYLANKVAEACSTPKPFVLPPIPYGVAYHHEDFKWTWGQFPHTSLRRPDDQQGYRNICLCGVGRNQ